MQHVIHQDPPRLKARDPAFYADLLITDLAQRLANFHCRVIQGSNDVPLLMDPRTPAAVRERYRTVIKQSMALLEFGACEGED